MPTKQQIKEQKAWIEYFAIAQLASIALEDGLEYDYECWNKRLEAAHNKAIQATEANTPAQDYICQDWLQDNQLYSELRQG